MRIPPPILQPSRRTFIKRSAYLGVGSTLAVNSSFNVLHAASDKVLAIMPGVFLPKEGRPIVESLSGANVENAPYVSSTDTLAKLMAPGGTKNYDLMISLTQFVKGPALGKNEGDERLHIPENDALTQSGGVLFDDKYKGKIAWRDDAHGMIMAAALHQGHSDPVNMSNGDLKEIKSFLTDRKKNVRTMWSKFGEAVGLMSSGEVWAMYGWIAMRRVLQSQGLNVTNNWPTDGLLIWNQSGFIPKDSPNAAASERVINAMLSTEFGAKLTEVTNYPSTSGKVAELYNEKEKRKLGFDVTDRGVKLYGLHQPANIDQWIEAWNEIKAS